MALAISGIQVVTPVPQTEDPLALFKELGAKFDWHESIAAHLVSSKGLATLEDFAFLLTSEAEANPLVEGIRDCPEERRMVMAGRVRRAWIGVREALDKSAKQKTKDAESACDLDAVFSKAELDSLEDVFWARHRFTLPPSVEPADSLKSRLHREIVRRVLTVRDIWGVRTLDHQMRASKKREQIAQNLILIGDGDDVDVTYEKCTEQYLRNLRTLLLAYAKAGAQVLPDAPPGPEKRGDDTTKFVQVPYDVLLRYYHRAETQVSRVPRADQLSWLASRDEAERAAWVELHRASQMTLGAVVKLLFEQREAMWVVQPEKRKEVDDGSSGRPAKAPRGNNASAPAGWAAHMRDGRAICMAWNRGGCAKVCPYKEFHGCAKLWKGRACGSKDHRAGVGKGCTR